MMSLKEFGYVNTCNRTIYEIVNLGSEEVDYFIVDSTDPRSIYHHSIEILSYYEELEGRCEVAFVTAEIVYALKVTCFIADAPTFDEWRESKKAERR